MLVRIDRRGILDSRCYRVQQLVLQLDVLVIGIPIIIFIIINTVFASRGIEGLALGYSCLIATDVLKEEIKVALSCCKIKAGCVCSTVI